MKINSDEILTDKIYIHIYIYIYIYIYISKYENRKTKY